MGTTGRREPSLKACIFIALLTVVCGQHAPPIDCSAAQNGALSFQQAAIGPIDAVAECTGYFTHGGYRFCGAMDDEAAERVCYELGLNFVGRSKRFKCIFTEGETFATTAPLETVNSLDSVNMLIGYSCQSSGLQHCFLDCYYSGTPATADATDANCNLYTTVTGVACLDIDECRDRAKTECDGPFDHTCDWTPACGPIAECENIVGDHLCTCPPNWNDPASDPYDLDVGCLDTNECEENFHICGFNGAQCINKPGSYACLCASGYVWDPTVDRDNMEWGSCVPQTCAEPPAAIPEGTRVSFGTDYTDTAVYSCNAGYVPSHATTDDVTFTVDCRSDGQWCPCTGPRCEEVPCGPPVLDPNAWMVVDGTGKGVFGDTAQFTCLPGFETSTKSTAYSSTCEDTGDWSAFDACIDVNECTSVVDACQDNAQCYNTIGTYYCICNPGYTGTGTVGDPCTPFSCGNIPGIVNAERTTFIGVLQSSFGDSPIEFRCLDGYESTIRRDPLQRAYTASIQCREDGEWDHFPLPECIHISCGDPGHLEYSERLPGSFFYGDAITFECCEGFRPIDEPYDLTGTYGPISTRCQANGQWTDKATCMDIDECSEMADPCGQGNHHCINTYGSFMCDCDRGYREDPSGTWCIKREDSEQLPCDVMYSLGLCSFGSCLLTDGRATCRCENGQFGPDCTSDGKAEFSNTLSEALTLAIISWALCGILIILVVVMCIRVCRRNYEPHPRHEKKERKDIIEVAYAQQQQQQPRVVYAQQQQAPTTANMVQGVLPNGSGGTYPVFA